MIRAPAASGLWDACVAGPVRQVFVTVTPPPCVVSHGTGSGNVVLPTIFNSSPHRARRACTPRKVAKDGTATSVTSWRAARRCRCQS